MDNKHDKIINTHHYLRKKIIRGNHLHLTLNNRIFEILRFYKYSIITFFNSDPNFYVGITNINEKKNGEKDLERNRKFHLGWGPNILVGPNRTGQQNQIEPFSSPLDEGTGS